MSTVATEKLQSAQFQQDGWRTAYQPPIQVRTSGGLPWGLLIGGLVVVGLGYMAWNTLGPDLRRYLKMERM
jgi:hypothetical protein